MMKQLCKKAVDFFGASVEVLVDITNNAHTFYAYSKGVGNKKDMTEARQVGVDIIHIMEKMRGTLRLAQEEICKKFDMVMYDDVLPEVEKVKFSGVATIVFWSDGTKTVVKAVKGDKFDKEKGLAMAFAKKAYGNRKNFYDKFIKVYTDPVVKKEKKPNPFLTYKGKRYGNVKQICAEYGYDYPSVRAAMRGKNLLFEEAIEELGFEKK